MLTHLRIQNLVLMERAELHFGPGFNVITGETGAGKSALLAAIRLIAGERAETQWVGSGGDLAVVEAILSPDQQVRREIHRSGRSRAFLNDELVSLGELRQKVGRSLERIDQMSVPTLVSMEVQRNLLDTYAESKELCQELANSFAEEQKLQAEIQKLILEKGERERRLIWAQEDLALLDAVGWKSEEEALLLEEHHLLSHSQQLVESLSQITNSLAEASSFKRSAHLLEQCARIDPNLKPVADLMRNASLEIEEISMALQTHLDRCEAKPQRLQQVEERITAIESIKKRFGKTHEEVSKKREERLTTLERLSTLEEEEMALTKKGEEMRIKNRTLGGRLSALRSQKAPELATFVVQELESLNLAQGAFEIQLIPQPLSPSGAEAVHFIFSANPGSPLLPLEECASGGELSRLLLALKIALAEKEESRCLVFDEIDSHVGGHTAAMLGDKLLKLSKGRQVICVTHFVQVAKAAFHHFLVEKREERGRTVSLVSPLSAAGADREREFLRMVGC